MTPGEERRARTLTDEDIEAIRGIACSCPNGMTANDVFRLRELLGCWDKARSAVGGYVIKIFMVLIISIGIMVAWITNK